MPRVNHSCIGNTDHLYIPKDKTKLLIASKRIPAGDEITFAYIHNPKLKMVLSLKWGFDCSCTGCTDNVLKDNLMEMIALDNEILKKGESGKVSEAIRYAKRLLHLHKQMESSSISVSRVNYDLFSLCISNRGTHADVRKYIKLAYETECLIYSGCKDETVGFMEKYKRYMENPRTHHNYSG